MGETTSISWTDHTFNPWIGCTKVSPACDGCYGAALMGSAGRMKRVEWGEPGKGPGTRSRTSPANWRQPRKWDRQARDAGVKRFVFCASLADVFDNEVPAEWRRDLFDLIRATPNLIWLLLTKRPGMIQRLYGEAMLDPPDGGSGQRWPSNAAIGCTVINQEEVDRDIPKLLAAKVALAPAFAFLSMEPLLGPVDLTVIADTGCPNARDGLMMDPTTGAYECCEACDYTGMSGEWGIDWVITGGETDQGGHKARPADPRWYRSLRDQCEAAGVPFHFKQWGEWQPFMGQVPTNTNPQGVHHFDLSLGAAPVFRLGKAHDPCTLDGVTHDARPVLP